MSDNYQISDEDKQLHEAVVADDVELLKELIFLGANWHVEAKNGFTPLHLAAENGSLSCLQALLDAGEDKDVLSFGMAPEDYSDERVTPLLVAARCGKDPCLNALLAAGANTEITSRSVDNNNSFTPLHEAAQAGALWCVMALIQAGANVGARSHNGATPLHLAAQAQKRPAFPGSMHHTCVNALLGAGADKDALVNFQYFPRSCVGAPLHEAALHGSSSCLYALLAAGADKEIKCKFSGSTPLHWAARCAHSSCVKALLDAGADVEARDDGLWGSDPSTPLDLVGSKYEGEQRHFAVAECTALLEAAAVVKVTHDIEATEAMRKAFADLDVNKDERLSVTELGVILRTLKPDQWSEAKLNLLFRDIDSDGSGYVDLDEFVVWLHDLDPTSKAQALSNRFTDWSHDAEAFCCLDGVLDDTTNPEVTFKQAVDSFPPEIKSAAKKQIYVASTFVSGSKCRDAMAKYPGVNKDRAAAIFLYTTESPVYKTLNSQLRSRDRGTSEFSRHWYPFTRILIEALRVMNNGTKTIIHRGVPLDLMKEHPGVYEKDGRRIWWAFSSCTTHRDQLEAFLGKGQRTILEICTSKGADISEFSFFSNESEHLLPPGLALKIDDVIPDELGVVIRCSDDEDAPDLLE